MSESLPSMPKVQDDYVIIKCAIACPSSRKRSKLVGPAACRDAGVPNAERLVSGSINAFGSDELSACAKLFNALKKDLLRVPVRKWSPDGSPSNEYLCRNRLSSIAMQLIADYQGRLGPLKQKVLAVHGELVADRRLELGPLFEDKHFPSVAELDDGISIRGTILPVPDPRLIVGSWDKEQTDAYQRSVSEHIRNGVKQTMQDAGSELVQRLHKLADTVPNYDGKQLGSYKNTIIDVPLELIRAFEDYNLTGDTQLSSALAQIRGVLEATSGPNMRENKDVAEKVAGAASRAAKEINAAMGSFGQPRA